jgi:hypothetical protein
VAVRVVAEIELSCSWGHHGVVISLELAVRLREAGLGWTPAPGDRFALPDRGLDGVFVLSDMTIQVYELSRGPVIGFNGTTEWALDDVEKDEAIWLPSEDQLRGRLGDTFQRLERVDGHYQVVAGGRRFVADRPEEAYGEALLHQLTS